MSYLEFYYCFQCEKSIGGYYIETPTAAQRCEGKALQSMLASPVLFLKFAPRHQTVHGIRSILNFQKVFQRLYLTGFGTVLGEVAPRTTGQAGSVGDKGEFLKTSMAKFIGFFRTNSKDPGITLENDVSNIEVHVIVSDGRLYESSMEGYKVDVGDSQ